LRVSVFFFEFEFLDLIVYFVLRFGRFIIVSRR